MLSVLPVPLKNMKHSCTLKSYRISICSFIRVNKQTCIDGFLGVTVTATFNSVTVALTFLSYQKIAKTVISYSDLPPPNQVTVSPEDM